MRLTWKCFSEVSNKITKALDHYSRFQPSVLSIQQFIDFGELQLVISEKGAVFVVFAFTMHWEAFASSEYYVVEDLSTTDIKNRRCA